MGVTDIFSELNGFKAKISAILQCHCCHSNGRYGSFEEIFKLFRYVFIEVISSKVLSLNSKF